jgi:CPA2 family monovalent cation:H+ antiporter-2
MEGFLSQAVIYLSAAVIAVPIASRMGLGSVLGYLAAGIIIGPVLGLVGSETADLQHFAEFGVVMMLFVIGLELEPRALWDMRHKLLGLGGLQITCTIAVIGGVAFAYGLAWQSALAIGMILSLSSTAIVLQTLNEKGLMQTPGGRSSFSVLLTQDIAVIPMLAMVPLLALPYADHTPKASNDHGIHETAHAAPNLLEGLAGWAVTLVTVGVIAGIILAGIFLIPFVFRFIHAARLREMYTAIALLIVVGIGYLMTILGLSPALGTFLAGVVLANSEFRHELESAIEPFKGLLLGLFFITVGAGINFGVLFGNPANILLMTLGVIAIKGAILFAIAVLFHMSGRSRMLFTLSLAQAGEFGFVLIGFSVQQHVLPPALSDQLLLIVALSMLITPAFFIAYDVLSRRIKVTVANEQEDEVHAGGPVIIAGIGRFGQIVNRLVRNSGYETVVLDNDLGMIQLMRRFGFKGFLGDPTRPEILHAAGLQKARVLVVAIDDKAACEKLIQYARSERPDLHIIARAHDRLHVYRLFRAGANDIVREMFDSSLRAGRYVLENIGLSEHEAHDADKAFYKHDRHAMRQLAPLWDPDTPVHENEAYVARAKELEQELEATMLTIRTGDGPINDETNGQDTTAQG